MIFHGLYSCKGMFPLTPFYSKEEIMKKRTKKIEIMTTQEEYEQLLQRKTKPRLAEWIRETCLNQKPKKKVATVDPLLLYELNKIGINLNQIAKKIQYSKNNIECLIEIIHIEQQLTCLLENDH